MKTKPSVDLKKFGLMTGGILMGLFGLTIPLISNHSSPGWPWLIGLSLWIVALIRPNLLKKVYELWMKFGDVLGHINTRIILAFLYFFVIVPIGVVKQRLGQDNMGKSFDHKLKTYKKSMSAKAIKHMERPFS